MKILVYDNNPDYGGHQIMAAQGIKALASQEHHDVVCMINPSNKNLLALLSGMQCIEPADSFQTINPDLVLCIQGDIAQSVSGIKIANQEGFESASYIAVPHTLDLMGAKLGRLRDRFNRQFINAPSRFITISESMKQILIERGCTKPITIVPNGIIQPEERTTPNSESTAIKTIGLIGRIEFNQKQQNFMVRAFVDHQEEFKDCRLLIAGNGPDEENLKNIIKGHADIELLPWQSDMNTMYNRIDMLVIPSRFEGVPLVMLEALARGIPVIGSARDGMKDLLPESWTFKTENADALAQTFRYVRENWKKDISALQQKVSTEHALESFQSSFVSAVIGK